MGNKKILLAGGGTAGHVEPALAVARFLRENFPELSIEFLGTSQGLETHLVPAAGFDLKTITKAPFPRKPKPAALMWPFKFLSSIAGTYKALSDVDLLIGFGGYVSSSAYIVARIKKIPIIVHEANSIPGKANTLGMKLGARGLVSFEESRESSSIWKSSTYVGIPLRKEVIALSSASEESRRAIRAEKAGEWGFSADKPIVLVFGGSQGSAHINSVIENSRELITKNGIQIVHAVGRAHPLPDRESGYTPLSYIDDLPRAYVAADLVISRSGAVTCHELSAIGTYSLLVPLPIGNGEQKLNALALVNTGRATLISNGEFTSRWLGEHLLGLIAAGKKLATTPHSSTVPLDATQRIVKIVIERLGEAK